MDGDRDLRADSEQGARTGTFTADSEQGRPAEKASRQCWSPVLGVSCGRTRGEQGALVLGSAGKAAGAGHRS